jgi:HSP20 family protein
MSAQKTTQPETSQSISAEQQKNTQTSLARRSVLPSVSSLVFDPFGFFSDDDPFTLLRRLQREMTRAVSQTALRPSDAALSTAWVPPIEVAYRDGNMVVSAELPGLTEKDVQIDINDGFVSIQGERKVEHEEDQGGVHRTERSYGMFYRAIPLPEGADTANARATFQNGVLQISVPVPQAQSNQRQIPIETTGSAQPQAAQQKPAASETDKTKKAA